MSKPEVDITYEISSDYFEPFKVSVRKGIVAWCSDSSHPVGTNWKALKESYENKINYKCYVKEVKEDDGNPQTVS